MHNELTNLLPNERKRALRHDYFVRLGAVAALMVTALALSAAVLLLPAYIFLTARASAEKAHLATSKSTLSSSGNAAFSEQLDALSNNTVLLSALAGAPSVSAIIRNALAIPHLGIALSSFTYASATDKNNNTLAISGIAITRDALRNYQLALQSAPFARSADLPVSAYAKDTDIAFTVTVTLTP